MQQKQIIDLYPPLIGVMMSITDVPDPVFAKKLVGDGIAIDPTSNKIYAPIDGIVKSVHPAKHAIIIAADAGFDILIHIGLETVSLGGDGFNIHVSDGDWIKQGDVIGDFDIDYLSQRAKALITPVVLLDLDHTVFHFTIILQDQTKSGLSIMQIHKNHAVGNERNTTSMINNLIKSDPILITNPHGIHTRPAAAISAIARKYDSEILIKKGDKQVNAKSIISLLGLAVNQNDTVHIYATDNEIIERLGGVICHIYDNSDDEQKSQIPSKYIEGSKYYGIAASFGLVYGVLKKRNGLNFLIQEHCDNILAEKNSYYEAINTVKKDIEHNLANLSFQDQIYRGILEAHIQILCDPDLLANCLKIINQKKSASFAVNQVFENQCNLMAQSNNPLLIERQDDFRDIRNRVLAAMNLIKVEDWSHSAPTILLADELSPTELVKLDKNVVGLISVSGGTTSHTAIIARAKGIPLLVGAHKSILEVKDNTLVLLNCKGGYVNISPKQNEIDEVNTYLEEVRQKQAIDQENAAKKAETKDGHLIDCYVNITNVADSKDLKLKGGVGIGLFRTEFIYFDRDTAPTVDEQYNIYADIASNVGEAPFVIRTLDAGGEKRIEYLDSSHEQNPVLGVRGVRLCLERKDLLIDQLTAIARVNKSNIKIMLPMISSLEEYRSVKLMFEEIKQKDGITANIEIGIMVEVPSVALMSNVFAEEVDFFSIGTNDLSQYILAIDRENAKLAEQIDHLHPAVIRSIDMVIKGAKTYNKPVSVCGLMAAEKLAIPLLIGLGVNQLSMSVNLIAENKAFIRNLNYSDCVAAASHCLKLSTTFEVRQHLWDKFIKISN